LIQEITLMCAGGHLRRDAAVGSADLFEIKDARRRTPDVAGQGSGSEMQGSLSKLTRENLKMPNDIRD
jgi:hypothetical protein